MVTVRQCEGNREVMKPETWRLKVGDVCTPPPPHTDSNGLVYITGWVSTHTYG